MKAPVSTLALVTSLRTGCCLVGCLIKGLFEWVNVCHPVLLSDFVVDQTQAVKFALDIACGMAFLHTLEPMIPRHYLNSKSVMVRIKTEP